MNWRGLKQLAKQDKLVTKRGTLEMVWTGVIHDLLVAPSTL
jgi:hypothetical protein